MYGRGSVPSSRRAFSQGRVPFTSSYSSGYAVSCSVADCKLHPRARRSQPKRCAAAAASDCPQCLIYISPLAEVVRTSNTLVACDGKMALSELGLGNATTLYLPRLREHKLELFLQQYMYSLSQKVRAGAQVLVYTAEEPVGAIVPATAGGSAALLATPKVHDSDNVPEDPTEVSVTAFGTHLSCVVWTANSAPRQATRCKASLQDTATTTLMVQ